MLRLQSLGYLGWLKVVGVLGGSLMHFAGSEGFEGFKGCEELLVF